MTITVVNPTSAGVSPAAGSIVLTVPTGTADGDVMLALIAVDGGSGATMTPPGGWTLEKSQDRTTTIKGLLYSRVASGEVAGTTTYTWSVSPNELMGGGIVTYRGVDTTTPMDATPTGAIGNSQSVDGATLTTVTDGAMVILGVYVQSATATTTPPSGYAEEFENSTGRICACDDLIKTTAGASGTLSAAMAGGVNKAWVAIVAALRPAKPPFLDRANQQAVYRM